MKVAVRFLFLLIPCFCIISFIQCSGDPVVKPEEAAVLGIEQIMSINSASIGADDSVFFSDVSKHPDGDIYLMDGDSVRVHHFDRSGKWIGSFLEKGEGPGEFLGYPKLQFNENYLWIIGRRKIGKFTKAGEFVEEYKQKSYFSAIRVVDENRFLGTKERFFEDKNGKSQSVKILGLFNLQHEKLLFTFLETGSNGRFFVPVGKRLMSVIPDAGLVPDLKFGLNHSKDEIVYADTKFYKLYKQNLTGEKKSEFGLKGEKEDVTEEVKERIINSFGKVQDDLKKRVHEGLPDYFCAIKKIRVLQNNSILVESLITGWKSAFDLFDEKGKFTRRFKIDPGFKYHALKFFNNKVGMIEDQDESSIYHEFEIKDSLFK